MQISSKSSKSSSPRVRNSLLTILASSNASNALDRWTLLAPSLALQILRSTTIPLTVLPHFESILAFHLSNPESVIYQEAEKRVLSQISPMLQKLVETYTPLTSLQVFEAATTKAAPARLTSGIKEQIRELATRITHIGTLHWRIWAPLVYLVGPDPARSDINRTA